MYELAKPKLQNVYHPKENKQESHLQLQDIIYYTIILEITNRLTQKYMGKVLDFESPFL